MTRHRGGNKRPTGQNTGLGSRLVNVREQVRKSHQSAKFDEDDIENAAFLEKEEKKVVDSITEESGIEEFLNKAKLAGQRFEAERDQVKIIEKVSTVIIPSKKDLINNLELQKEFEHRLRIPRRPPRELWSNAEELTLAENEVFLKWRKDLADLQEVDGLALTPFERNPEMWRELWRVVERSDIIVQIVDARNPLLFRSIDLENYVKEVDPTKQNLLLVNKADLLLPEQVRAWTSYFRERHVNILFWSAMTDMDTITEEVEKVSVHDDEAPVQPSCSNSEDVKIIRRSEDLITHLKKMGCVRGVPGEKQLIVGMVGYPNVGKSSTINKMVGTKMVSVSATPGKTKHFQTIHIDKELCLCDCPGLVMPSFSFGRNEMFLNGTMPVDQMREHFGPTALLLSRVPIWYIEKKYSVMLPKQEKPSAINVLTAIAYMRGFMSQNGVPDCSRAARLLLKDVVCGKILWVAAPPTVDQDDFNKLMFPENTDDTTSGAVQLEYLLRKGLVSTEDSKNTGFDKNFFKPNTGQAHIRTFRSISDARAGLISDAPTGSPIEMSSIRGSKKKHFNHNKREKLRRVYKHQDEFDAYC